MSELKRVIGLGVSPIAWCKNCPTQVTSEVSEVKCGSSVREKEKYMGACFYSSKVLSLDGDLRQIARVNEKQIFSLSYC